MGMCSYVIGFKPKDEKYDRMKLVYECCVHAQVTIPDEVTKYFGDYNLDDAGIRIDDLPNDCYKEWFSPDKNEAAQGIEVYLDKLPDDIKIIRFVNSW